MFIFCPPRKHGIILAGAISGEKKVMRVLVISDIHANLAAFDAVLQDAEGQWDKIWCLGDLVGYGPDPNACVARLREFDHISLSGNHDWATLGKIHIDSFNREAQMAIQWTRDTITETTREYLAELPPQTVLDSFTIVHASPRMPVWEYILDAGTATANFSHFDTPYCLAGHTHTPVIFEEVDAIRTNIFAPMYDEPVSLKGRRVIINPGSVGQPRDSDPRAAYALLDTTALTWEHCRVDYPIEVTQARMRKQNFPYRLIARLDHGW